MEYPLNFLKLQRKDLVRQVQEKTNNAVSYQQEADALRARAADLLKQADAKEYRCSKACELRNSFQASLNQVDAAIALLEK